MRRLFLILLSILSAFTLWADSRNYYEAEVYLDEATNEILPISVTLPEVKERFIYYTLELNKSLYLSQLGFDKHIMDVKAVDAQGTVLKLRKIDEYSIEIKTSEAKQPIRLEYYVKLNENTSSSNFLAAGLIFREKECYLLNYNLLIGYLDGYRHLPLSIRVKRPSDFYGSGSMAKEISDEYTDIYLVENYDALFDQPVLYAQADTAQFSLRENNFTISIYSEDSTYTSADIRETVVPVIQAVQNFIGAFPIDSYDLVFYFSNDYDFMDSRSLKYGGLMHSSSSFYVFPELEDADDMNSIIQKTVMHELLHFISPHILKSSMLEEGYSIEKEFSQHLWLYEGVIEYFTWLLLVREGLISEETFINILRENIDRMLSYPKVSLTQMSRHIHLPKYAAQYNNIYKRGSLAAFILDVELRKYSRGKQGLEDIILDMYREYSVSGKTFNEHRLFGEMQERTDYDLKNFIAKYVDGRKTFRLSRHLADIGYTYEDVFNKQQPYFGRFQLEILLREGKVTIIEASQNPLGILDGDRILSINDEVIDASNLQYVYDKLIYPKEVEPIRLNILRNGYLLKLDGSPYVRRKPIKHYMKDNPLAPESAYYTRYCLFYKAPLDKE